MSLARALSRPALGIMLPAYISTWCAPLRIAEESQAGVAHSTHKQSTKKAQDHLSTSATTRQFGELMSKGGFLWMKVIRFSATDILIHLKFAFDEHKQNSIWRLIKNYRMLNILAIFSINIKYLIFNAKINVINLLIFVYILICLDKQLWRLEKLDFKT